MTKGNGRRLAPQPHGGALSPGAGGGPQPGSGRPPSAIRNALRKGLDERIRILESIADDPEARASDRIRAIDILAKYGLGPREGWDRDAVVDLMQQLGRAVAELVKDERILGQIRERWLAILRSYGR